MQCWSILAPRLQVAVLEMDHSANAAFPGCLSKVNTRAGNVASRLSSTEMQLHCRSNEELQQKEAAVVSLLNDSLTLHLEQTHSAASRSCFCGLQKEDKGAIHALCR